MILRSLTTAIRKQDWFTVAVETLIVVFGVLDRLEQDFEQILERAALSLAAHECNLKALGG